MDYDEDKIRHQIIAGMKAEPWQVELEQFAYGARLGVFLHGGSYGIQRVQTDTKGRTEDQIAFDLLRLLMNAPLKDDQETKLACAAAMFGWKESPYEGKAGRHPATCTCSKHKGLDASQAA